MTGTQVDAVEEHQVRLTAAEAELAGDWFLRHLPQAER
jgi:hypothetical protein